VTLHSHSSEKLSYLQPTIGRVSHCGATESVQIVVSQIKCTFYIS